MIVKCQICGAEIAETSAEELSLPIKGSMFRTHRTGFPDPFMSPDLEWEHMKCRYCQKRPFIVDDEIMTTDGLYRIEKEKSVMLANGKLEYSEKINPPIICTEDTIVQTSVILTKDGIKTKTEEVEINDNTCLDCGKVCKTKAGLVAHKRFCKGEK